MELHDLENKWKKSFDESLKSIRSMLKHGAKDNDYTKDCKDFMKWIVETDEDPYYFLPQHYVYLRDNIFETEMFLNQLHHALIDDGDVCFVTFKYQGKVESVKLLFAYPYDDGFKDIVLKENENFIKFKNDSFERSSKTIAMMNEKLEAEGKNLLPFPEKFNVDDVEIIADNDFKKFKNDVINYLYDRRKEMAELEEKRVRFLNNLNNK